DGKARAIDARAFSLAWLIREDAALQTPATGERPQPLQLAACSCVAAQQPIRYHVRHASGVCRRVVRQHDHYGVLVRNTYERIALAIGRAERGKPRHAVVRVWLPTLRMVCPGVGPRVFESERESIKFVHIGFHSAVRCRYGSMQADRHTQLTRDASLKRRRRRGHSRTRASFTSLRATGIGDWQLRTQRGKYRRHPA